MTITGSGISMKLILLKATPHILTKALFIKKMTKFNIVNS